MAETDILLTTGLDTKDAYKDAEHLQKEIEDIFKSRKGVQSATLTSIEIQMKKLSQQSNELRTSMQEMLDIHADYSDVTSQFSSLYNEIQALEDKMFDFSTPMSDEELDEIQNKMVELYDEMAPLLSQMEELEQFQVPTEEFAALQEQYKNLMSEVEKGNIKYSKAQEELDKLEKEMNKMRMAGTAMVAPESLEEFQKYQTKLDSVNDKMKQLIIRHNEASKSGTKTFSRLSGTLNTLKTAISKVVTGFKKLLGHFTGIKRTTSGPSNPFKSLLRNLLRFGLGLASIYMLVNKLRAAVKEGFSNLYKDNKAFKKSVDSLKGSLTTFKNSLAAAFQPIVSVAIPHIQKLVDWMTQLMQQVAKFSAAITGQKYYMKAIKQTGDAAEKAQKQLAGFDKLNVINSDGTGAGTMFEEVPLEDAQEMLDKFKKLFSLEGLYGLGKTFAEKINQFLENIQWSKIKQKADEVGRKFATLLNGWIDNLHWENIGTTLAEIFNTIFSFLYRFVSTLHWDKIGKGIADAIMGFFENTDFDKIADTIAGAINGMSKLVANLLNFTDFKKIGTKIGEFLNRTIKKINWKRLGENLKNLVVGLADIVINLMKAVDWEDVGNKIGEFLKEFFEGEPNPLLKVGEALWEALKAAVKVFAGVAKENPLAAIIIGGLLAAKTLSLFTAVGTTLGLSLNGGLLSAITTGAAGIVSSFGKLLGGGLINLFGIQGASFITGTIAPLVATALAGLGIGYLVDTYLLDPLGVGIDNWYDDQQQKAAEEAAEWADHTADVATTAWNSGLEAAANELDWTWLTDAMDVEGHDEAWDKLVIDVEDGIRRMNAAGVDLSDTAAVLEYIGNPLKAGWLDSNAKQYIQMLSEDWDNLSTSTQNALLGIEQVSETQSRALQASEAAAKEYAQSMSDTYNSTIDGMIEDTATQTNSLTTLYLTLKGNLKSIFNSIIGGSEKMSNGVADGINGIANSLNSMRFTLPDWIPGVGGKSLSFNIPRVSKISIPKLAQGAVIPPNKEFLAMLGDQKQGTNIEAPLDTIKQAFAEVMMQMGGTSDNSDIVINIDGDEVFRVIRDKDRVFKKSTGRSAFA